jgi:hypothetical protein
MVTCLQGVTQWQRSDDGVCYPVLNIFVTLSRKPGFYFSNVAVPIFLLVMLGFTSEFISDHDIADRMQITLTLLLTLVAYKFVINQHLPTTNYQTWLDHYVNAAYTFLFLIAIQNWGMYMLDKAFPESDTASRINAASGVILAGGWLALHAAAAVAVVQQLRRRAREALLDDVSAWSGDAEEALSMAKPTVR